MLDQSQRNVDIYANANANANGLLFAPFTFCRGSIDDPSELLKSHMNLNFELQMLLYPRMVALTSVLKYPLRFSQPLTS